MFLFLRVAAEMNPVNNTLWRNLRYNDVSSSGPVVFVPWSVKTTMLDTLMAGFKLLGVTAHCRWCIVVHLLYCEINRAHAILILLVNFDRQIRLWFHVLVFCLFLFGFVYMIPRSEIFCSFDSFWAGGPFGQCCLIFNLHWAARAFQK